MLTLLTINTPRFAFRKAKRNGERWFKIARFALKSSPPFFPFSKFVWNFRGAPGTAVMTEGWKPHGFEGGLHITPGRWRQIVGDMGEFHMEFWGLPSTSGRHFTANKTPRSNAKARRLLRCYLEQVRPCSPVRDSYRSALTPDPDDDGNTWEKNRN